jgi:hypothetical protein
MNKVKCYWNVEHSAIRFFFNFLFYRFEYGEMNITKLNQKIDNIEDEIYREKLKIKKCADELGDTFDDMLSNY